MINDAIIALNNIIWGWPLIIFIVACGMVLTIGLKGIQFREFFTIWKETLFSNETPDSTGDMTSFQAFVNALSTSLGNGSIAGMATAIQAGGPGAAFWVFMMGFLGMAIRFAEVFLACFYPGKKEGDSLVGGPMIYLAQVPGGKILPYAYTVFLFLLSIVTGNAMQANSIRVGFVRILHVNPYTVAFILFAFICYVILGGAKRIIDVSDKIVPVKVGVFFLSACIILIYHYQAIIPALQIILQGAFTPEALTGGAIGLTVQNAIRFGLVRSLNASEAGLGVAAVLFGATGTKHVYRTSVMSMLSAFISANLVCSSIALMIVASGVWNSGETGLDLTISAYQTVFGSAGGWIATFLAVSFGIGCLVSYAYVARACWLFLTNGKYIVLFNIVYCLATFLGAIGEVKIVWNSTDLVNAGLLITNLFGLIWLLPIIQKNIKKS
jgi:alanine or glycine:cation symporter, AGCS family